MTRRLACMGLAVVLSAAHISAADAQPANRLIVGVDFTGTAAWPSAEQAVSFDLNAEQGDFRARHSPETTAGVSVHADGRVWRRMTLGAAISYESGAVQASIDARLPHPFFFRRPRSVAGILDGMKQNALGLAIKVGWRLPLTERIDLHVTGGPLWLRLDYPVVTSVRFAEMFPFDTATFSGADSSANASWGAGVTAGADVGWRWRRHLGFETGVAFRRVSVDSSSITDRGLTVDAGRLHVRAGVRLSY